MIRWATAAMTPQLIDLWGECFGDPPELVRMFLRRPDVRCMVQAESGVVQSAAYLIPAQLHAFGQRVPVWYEYALATRPALRGQGRMAGLLEGVRRAAAANGLPYTVLVPENAGLARYYERLGYVPFFTVREVTCPRDRLAAAARTAAPLHFRAHAARSVGALRRCCLRGGDSLEWSGRAAAFALRFARRCGDRVIRVPGGYAVVRSDEARARITEWMCLPSAEAELCSALWAQTTAAEYVFRLPEHAPLFAGSGAVRPFGWLRATGHAPVSPAAGAYLGLEMD